MGERKVLSVRRVRTTTRSCLELEDKQSEGEGRIIKGKSKGTGLEAFPTEFQKRTQKVGKRRKQRTRLLEELGRFLLRKTCTDYGVAERLSQT